MKFEYDGVQYAFWFRYEEVEAKPRGVWCHIEKVSPEGHRLIRRGHARCAEVDQFVKERGRKIALRRALDDFGRPFRKVAWHAYLSRSRDGWTAPAKGTISTTPEQSAEVAVGANDRTV